MRARKLFTLLTVAALAAVTTIAVGCGGDDNVTSGETPFNQTTAYQLVTDQVNGVVDELLDAATTGFDNTGGVTPPPVFAEAPDSTIVGDGWTVYWRSNLAAGVSTMIIDSIQFRANGVVQETANGADEIVVRHISQQTSTDTTQTFENHNLNVLFTISNLDQTTATGTGTVALTMNAKTVGTTTIREDYSVTGTLTGFQASKSGQNWVSCPNVGSASVTVEAEIQSGSQTAAQSDWTVVGTFTNGSMSATVTSGTNQASYTQVFCQ